MKKLVLLSICILGISTSAFADVQSKVLSFNNKTTQELEINHNKHEYIKKGRYIYRFDNNGELISYYETTLSGKKITEYDLEGNIVKSYRIKPGGKIDIYNSKGTKIGK